MDSHYDYFRLTLKESGYVSERYKDLAVSKKHDTDSARYCMTLSEFGIYDASGNRLNGGMTTVGSTTASGQNMTNVSAVALIPGQAAVENGATFRYYIGNNSSSRRLPCLFDGTRTYSNGMDLYQTGVYPSIGNASSHCKIVMRLADATAEAAFYDLAAPRGTNGVDYIGRDVTAYAIEGSADGRVWEKLAEDDDAILPSGNGGWYGATRTTFKLERTMLALTNVTSVAVAPGAKLTANGPVAPIKKLVLDARGAGTIEGFEFAEEGVLEVASMANKCHVAISIGLSGVESAANIGNWTVVSGGKVRDWRVQMGDGVIYITRPGLVILVD